RDGRPAPKQKRAAAAYPGRGLRPITRKRERSCREPPRDREHDGAGRARYGHGGLAQLCRGPSVLSRPMLLPGKGVPGVAAASSCAARAPPAASLMAATRAGAAAMAHATICGRACGARATAALTIAGTTPRCSGAGTARTAAQAIAGANGVRSGTTSAAMAEVTTLGARARRSGGWRMPTTALTMGAASSDRPAATACAVAWGAPAGFASTARTTSAVAGGGAEGGDCAPAVANDQAARIRTSPATARAPRAVATTPTANARPGAPG